MFDNIAGIDNATTATTNTKVNQIDSLLELAKNRIGQREGLQQWINKNIKSLPTICTGRVVTIVRKFDEIQQDLSDTLWTICMLSIQQQGYTSVALLSAVTATSINKSTTMNSKQADWKESSIWLLNELSKLGMVETKIQEIDTDQGKRNQTLFYICPNWSKAHLNDIIEDIRAKTSIVCKPLEFCPPNWMEGEKHQERTRLKLVNTKADTLVDYRASKEALEPLNILQRVGFEIAEGSKKHIFACLDNESDEMKRQSFTDLIDLDNKRFFFPVSADYRFRMYYRGGTIHPQAQKEVRQFLNFSQGEMVLRTNAIDDLTTALKDRENPVQRDELNRLEAMTDEYIISKVIIHKDGTANGLQWQSVLLRSKKLATLTKLLKDTLTEEVYQHVTNVICQADIKVTRKFIKQIVMTASYGATKNTQLERLSEQLTPQDAKKAYNIINTEIPELKQYTNYISSRCKQFETSNCQMNTPDDFQLSFRKIDRTESTLFAGAFSAIVGTTYQEDPDATARATAPNIIHMCDSYHMRQVVKAWKGNICTIHDSVGVVAGRGKELQQLILDTFKAAHEENDFLASWAEANKVEPLAKRGTLELDEINNTDMFC